MTPFFIVTAVKISNLTYKYLWQLFHKSKSLYFHGGECGDFCGMWQRLVYIYQRFEITGCRHLQDIEMFDYEFSKAISKPW
jgi:hypothetical protein